MQVPKDMVQCLLLENLETQGMREKSLGQGRNQEIVNKSAAQIWTDYFIKQRNYTSYFEDI
jgi:hypothetical protein